MGDGRDWRETRELHVSGAGKGAPYGRTLPPELDGRWAEGLCTSRFFYSSVISRGWKRDAGAGEQEPRLDAGPGPDV